VRWRMACRGSHLSRCSSVGDGVHVVLAEVTQKTSSGWEIVVIVQHDKPVVGGCRTDQPVDDREALLPTSLSKAILCGVDPTPDTLGDRYVRVEIGEHVRHLIVFVEIARRAPQLGSLRAAGADGSVIDLMPPCIIQLLVTLEAPDGGGIGEIPNQRQVAPFSAPC
jgi:hypothetical protein